MKMVKKVFAVAIAIVMALSVLGVCASALGTANGDEYMTVNVTTNKSTYSPSETVIVTVSIKNNYNATCFRFPILFDSSVYEMPTLINLTTYNSCNTKGTIASNTSNNGQFIPSNYSSDSFGCVLVQWTASVTGGTVGAINSPDGETAFSFELKTKSAAAGKTGTILIPAESDLFYYQAIQDTTDATTLYYMDSSSCTMTFTPANASVVGESVALVPNSANNSQAVIDEDTGVVSGLGVNMGSAEDVRYYLAATGGATIRVTPTDLGYGTGSTVSLVVDGQVVKSYQILVYGDVDGSAGIDGYDTSIVLNVNLGSSSLEDAAFAAADLTGDGSVDGFDLSVFLNVVSGVVEIDQANPF
ncbi:MAG: dockerin type I repeat-containing protein [Clostridia bacterium]|nr:dockerin type I repeat-containing protein [Clostridia bacterium]